MPLHEKNYPFIITNRVGGSITFFCTFFSFLSNKNKLKMINMIILTFKKTPEKCSAIVKEEKGKLSIICHSIFLFVCIFTCLLYKSVKCIYHNGNIDIKHVILNIEILCQWFSFSFFLHFFTSILLTGTREECV